MTRKITTSILTALALIAVVPNARAEIASKAYVDERDNVLLFGTATPDSETLAEYEENGGIVGAIDGKVNSDDVESIIGNYFDDVVHVEQEAENAIIVTDANGNMSTATGGYITNAKISSSADIELGKLHFPTPPSTCSTTGCMLMFYNNQYVWEPVTRDTNETIATTGAVSATATATTTTTSRVRNGWEL